MVGSQQQADDTNGQSIELGKITDLVIAGWAGRDRAAVEHHIAELAALGVPRPNKTPTFYRVSSQLLSQHNELEEVGNTASGEVEAVIVIVNGEAFVSVGSDHTDRDLETVGVALSKQVCAKPIAKKFWPLSEVADHWDALIIRSWAEIDGNEVLYQEGSVSANLRPKELMKMYNGEIGSGGAVLADGTAMFCGTLPVIGGVRPADAFRIEIEDPILQRRISHTYSCRHLPVVG